MYFKKIKGTNAEYLYLVESYRAKNSSIPKQRTLLSLGKIDNLQEEQLQNMAKTLLNLCENSSIVDLATTDETSRQNWGIPKIIDKLWEYFKLDLLFDEIILKNRTIKYDLKGIIKLILADRLHSPCSKYKSYLRKEYYEETANIKLHNIYKSLTEIYEHKELIEKYLFEESSKKLNLPLDLVLFDVTTLHFESNQKDAIRNFGYSKDAKFNEVQLVVSLLVTKDGYPVGMDLFPGNTYEGHTLITAIKKLKNAYKINKVIIVADRGINSVQNLFVMHKMAKIKYIVSTRIKNASKDLQTIILDDEGYVNTAFEKEITVDKKRPLVTEDISFPSKMICTWSLKRAQKDQIDRERLVNKANNIIKYGDSSDCRGAKKYIKSHNKQKELNSAKIKADEKWGGFYAVETNDLDLSAEEILHSYGCLWKIEESFRVLKGHLDMRPVYHWTKERIIGHCIISYIAFLFERTLEYLLNKNNTANFSTNKIRESINKMEFSTILFGKKSHKIYGKLDLLGVNILETLNIELPKKAIVEG